MNERSLRLSNSPGLVGRIFGAVVGAVFVAGGLFFAVMAVAGEWFFDDFSGMGCQRRPKIDPFSTAEN